jgi:antirestriction protein ArdC
MDIYQIVTDKVLAQLEAGTPPWVQPWSSKGGQLGLPHNAISGKPYRGINPWLLCGTARGPGNGWMTYKQAQDIGANVRRGEKGSMIVFFKPWTVTDKNAAPREDGTRVERKIPILRHFTVFHTSQIENLPARFAAEEPAPVSIPDQNSRAAALMAQATVLHGGDSAFYRHATDSIHLPLPGAFSDMANYYATALHELTHWTGAPSRLAREYGKRFGDSAYAREELVAEMGAAYLCAACGIDGQLQHASYLKLWIAVLQEDKRAIVMAGAAAQKAADFVQGVPAFVAEDSAAGGGIAA